MTFNFSMRNGIPEGSHNIIMRVVPMDGIILVKGGCENFQTFGDPLSGGSPKSEETTYDTQTAVID